MYDRKEIEADIKELLQEPPEPDDPYKQIIIILGIVCGFTLLQTVILSALFAYLR